MVSECLLAAGESLQRLFFVENLRNLIYFTKMKITVNPYRMISQLIELTRDSHLKWILSGDGSVTSTFGKYVKLKLDSNCIVFTYDHEDPSRRYIMNYDRTLRRFEELHDMVMCNSIVAEGVQDVDLLMNPSFNPNEVLVW